MIITRYMTTNETERIVAHIFAPLFRPGDELGDDTLGQPRLVTRNQPGDLWGIPRDIGPAGVSLAEWRATVEAHGFKWEVQS